MAVTEDIRRDTRRLEPPHTREVRLLSDTPVGDDAHDMLGFSALAEVLSELIDSERTDTPLTIAISAPWGAGKTTMARLIECRLARLTAQRNGERPTVICWFNAWQHNDAPHLGAALAAAVAHETDRLRPRWRRVLNPLPPSLISPRARCGARCSSGSRRSRWWRPRCSTDRSGTPSRAPPWPRTTPRAWGR